MFHNHFQVYYGQLGLFVLLSLSVYSSINCIVYLSALYLLVVDVQFFCSGLCIPLTVWAYDRTTSSCVAIISFILHSNVVINFSRSFHVVSVVGEEESLSSPCLEAQNIRTIGAHVIQCQ